MKTNQTLLWFLIAPAMVVLAMTSAPRSMDFRPAPELVEHEGCWGQGEPALAEIPDGAIVVDKGETRRVNDAGPALEQVFGNGHTYDQVVEFCTDHLDSNSQTRVVSGTSSDRRSTS